MKQPTELRSKSLRAAIALALTFAASDVALALGMPGAGTVTVGEISAIGNGTLTGSGVGSTITRLGYSGLTPTNTATLTVKGNTVVQWGGPGAPANDDNPAGFNVASGHNLYVKGAATNPGNVGLLNVDASGNPSRIAGVIQNTGTKRVNIFIANANGITVTSSGVIAAPVVGLIGADLAAAPKTPGGPPVANAAQTLFGDGALVPVSFGTTGAIDMQGTIEGVDGAGAMTVPNTPATNAIIAGSGSVNVDYTNIGGAVGGVVATDSQIFGGTAFEFMADGTANLNVGTDTAGVSGYAPTNVSLTNADPTQVFADGSLSFAGVSTLPSNATGANYGWMGTLSNTGTLFLADPGIYGGGSGLFTNPWYGNPNPAGGGFVQTPVGDINNRGTIFSGGTGTDLGIYANGFTNSGTLTLGPNDGLVVDGNDGPINLGGMVQASGTDPFVSHVDLRTRASGNIHVTAPLKIRGSYDAFDAVADNGDVNLAAPLVIDTNANSSGVVVYHVHGNAVTITADQTIQGGTTPGSVGQGTAELHVNQPGQTVTIGSGATLTAGDVEVGYGDVGKPSVITALNRVNLVLDGNIVATNTGQTIPGQSGDILINAVNITGNGKGSMTGRVFGFNFTGNVRKSTPYLTNNFWRNGLILHSIGAEPTLNLYAAGEGRQFVNLRVNGDITVNSTSATGAPASAGYYGTAGTSGFVPGNAFSQMMLMATGNITVAGASTETVNTLGDAGWLSSRLTRFWWPGLLYFGNIPSVADPAAIGTGSITSLRGIYNNVMLPVPYEQGMYFMTRNLSLNGNLYTNINSPVYFATRSILFDNHWLVYSTRLSAVANTRPAQK